MKIQLCKEIQFKTTNEPGTVGKVTTAIAKSGANLLALCAYADTDKDEGSFLLYTDNNSKAVGALKALGYKPTEAPVVCAELPNKPGALAECARKLGEADIDINYTYCTAQTGTNTAFWIMSTDDNDQALKLLSR